MIEVRNLTKYYGSKKALNDVSFQINPGEVVGLLGPNGAGKTTTLNIITGVIFPNEGQVYINDKRLDENENKLKSQIGYLAEDNPLYPNLLVYESLKLAAELKNMKPVEFQENIGRVAAISGLRDVLYQPIDSLSKGYKQRVGLAQALISNPPILILDEPTEGLDPNQRQEIRNLIKELGKEYTVLLSTHVMQEVEAICQRVIILNDGEIATSGTVEEVTQTDAEHVEMELEVKGSNADWVRGQIKDQFPGVNSDNEILIVRVKNDQIDALYEFIGDKTSGQAYITYLQKKQERLEDVFKRVTT